ncbi:MAG: hypothetical protein ACFFBH_04655 [Promethearchaeota archaeon]
MNDKRLLFVELSDFSPVDLEIIGNKAILVQSFGSFELDGISNGYCSIETLSRIKNDEL